MKNKKILIALISVAAVLFLMAPYFMGILAKNKIDQHSEILSNIPGYVFKVKTYEKGWFTSEAVISYGFDQHTLEIMKGKSPLNEENKAILDALEKGLIFDISIAHGPVTFQNGVDFSLFSLDGNVRDGDLVNILKITTDWPLLTLDGDVSYAGNMTFNLTGSSFTVSNKDKMQDLTFKGMKFTANINRDISHYFIQGKLNGLQVTTSNATMVVQNIRIESEADRLNDFLWVGKGTSTIEEVSTSNSGTSLFSLKDFFSSYTIGKQDDVSLQATIDLKIAQTNIPHLNLENIKTNLKISNIDIAGLTDYVRAVYDIRPEELSLVGLKMIQRSPEMTVKNIHFEIGDSAFDSTGKFSLDGKGIDSIDHMRKTLKKSYKADVSVSFDKGIAEQLTLFSLRQKMRALKSQSSSPTEEQLVQMAQMQTGLALQSSVQQGLLNLDGELYRSHIEIKEGKTLINGKEMKVPGL